MKKNKKTLVILDAHALIHRSYHALPSFTSPSGEPMGAVYGVSAVLLKLLRELRPTHIAAAFDREEPTFRHKAYEGYKATRQETKDDLIPQFDKTKELFRAFKIPVFEVPGFEADDIIGTLVELFKKEKDLTIMIASGDMDTLQLVEDQRVCVYTLRKGIEDTIVHDEDKVRERFTFGPEHITDYKGLKGDPSDNIIGVKGIGEKTATQLIQEYGSLEDIFKKIKKEKKHPSWLKERIVKLLEENEEEALFSKELATIRKDAPVKPSLEDLQYPSVPYADAVAIFKKFHFPSLISRLPTNQEPLLDEVVEESKEEVSISEKDIQSLSKESPLAVYVQDEKLYITSSKQSFSVDGEMRVSYHHDLKSLFENVSDLVAYDAKAISHWLGFACKASFDLYLASLVLDPEARSLGLDDVVEGKKKPSFKDILAVERKQRLALERQGLSQTYFEFELPLIPVLFLMEQAGILIDQDALVGLEEKVSSELSDLEKKIWKHAGEDFDINSPKQLTSILFEKLKLPTKGIKKTSTKAISTQASELIKLQGAHPIIDLLMRYRELSKLLSTYISTLPKLVDEEGRIHTTFNQIGAATGRMSSNNPNLQNIPIRTELGREVRRAFVAKKGYVIASFDYSQLELRIAAALSLDPKLTDAFISGQDIHARTAAEIFHVELSKVTPHMRRSAKTINFGILYGMGARALASGIGVSVAEAEEYLKEYLKEFSGIAAYREKIITEGKKKGYVETFFGRKRYLPNLRSSFEFVRKEAERMAINAPFQGTASDLIKRAMIRIAKELSLGEENQEVRMLLQVHDELLFEIQKDKIDEYAQKISSIMEDVPEFSVPIEVDVKVGKSWDEAEKIHSHRK